jgi:elongation factor G
MARTSAGSDATTFSTWPRFTRRATTPNTARVPSRTFTGRLIASCPAHAVQERLQRAIGSGQLRGPELIIVGAAHQDRQLRTQMRGEVERQPVPRRPERRAEHVPGELPVGAYRLVPHQLVEPCVRGLQGLVENLEALVAHGVSPQSSAPDAGRGRARRKASGCQPCLTTVVPQQGTAAPRAAARRRRPRRPAPRSDPLEIPDPTRHDRLRRKNEEPREEDMTRTIAVLGAANTGKSTLVDRMCALEGQAQPAAPPGELRVCGFTHLDERWQVIDTPGSIEFAHVGLDALLAADAAVICVAPDPADALLAAPYLHAAESAGTPALVFINRIDETAGRVRDIVAALQDYATHPIVLRQVPIRDGERVVGAVDLVSERAWAYHEGGPSTLIEIPAGMLEREHEARDGMLEQLSEHDDHLLEELIEDKAPPSAEVYAICARVLAENRVIEALIGSGLHGNGIVRVMKALRHEAPRVDALRARLQAQAGLAEPPAAAVFSGAYRKHMGKTLLLRALEPLPSSRPLGGRAPGQLTPADPRDTHPMHDVPEGEIVTAVKSDHLTPGKLATQGALHDAPPWSRPLPPLQYRLFAATSERDSVKLSGALATLAEGDSALVVTQDPATGGALVGAQGPLHLRVLRQRLKDAFGMEVEEHAPAPAYRETISKTQDTAYRHKKQTGGAGQFADVKLTVAPTARGDGFAFAEVVKGGAVPRNYIPAVEAGARDALERGPLGFPVVDVSVTLTDGQHHAVDSSDMAFRIAGRQGTREALKAAGPVLLQPIFRVAIHAPSVFTGNLGPIIASHAGQMLGFDVDPGAKGWEIFRALVPGSALSAFANDVRAATQGVGYFETEFDHYEEMHGKAADRIVQERAREPA